MLITKDKKMRFGLIRRANGLHKDLAKVTVEKKRTLCPLMSFGIVPHYCIFYTIIKIVNMQRVGLLNTAERLNL